MDFIPIANTYIGEEEARSVYDVIKSGWISMGKKVQEFEQAVCDYTGSKYAVAMNNGTSTLQSLLIALDIGPGDEVILPTLTYISSANVVLYQGATPVLCECDPKTYNVDASHIREKITKKTKAFMSVDMKGLPVDYDSLLSLSDETNIPFISDSAESLGAIYKGKKVGTQALAHSFSFFANKNITTGEGGMITTDDESLFKKLQVIRNQGQSERYKHVVLGNNFRMTDISAAFGIEQLKRVDWLMTEKNKLAKVYDKLFSDTDKVSAPYIPDYADRHSWYMYSVSLEKEKRDLLVNHLKDSKKIDTRLSFPPVHIQPYYVERFNYSPSDLKISYDAFCSFLDIPIWIGLSLEQQEYIANSIISFLNHE